MYLHIHYLFGSFKLGVDGLLFLCNWAGNRRGETRHRTQKGVPEDQGHGLPSQRSCSLPPPGGGAGRGAAVGHCTPPSMSHAVPTSLLRICYSTHHPPPLEFTLPGSHIQCFSAVTSTYLVVKEAKIQEQVALEMKVPSLAPNLTPPLSRLLCESSRTSFQPFS